MNNLAFILLAALLGHPVPIFTPQEYLRAAHIRHNATWFGGKLPDTTVLYAETPDGDEGETICAKDWKVCSIFISPKYNPGLNEAELTLFHEECHEVTPTDFGHGPEWQNCMKRLAAAGAFERLW